MKVDVVITFFRRQALWPYVLRGLEANKDFISRLIIVNDEPWVEELASPFPTTFLSFPDHKDMGISRSMNLGAKHVNTPYFIHLDDDAVALPNTFEILLAYGQRPRSFTSGYAVQSTPETFDQDFEQPPKSGGLNLGGSHPWQCVCGAFFLTDTQAFLDNPWNEAMVGYGFQDYEFAARWVAAGNSLRMYPVKCLHLGPKRSSEDGDFYNKQILNDTLAQAL